MSIIGLIIVLVIIGVILWLVNTYIPMAPMIKSIMNVLVAILVLLWILQVFGLLGGRIGPVLH